MATVRDEFPFKKFFHNAPQVTILLFRFVVLSSGTMAVSSQLLDLMHRNVSYTVEERQCCSDGPRGIATNCMTQPGQSTSLV